MISFFLTARTRPLRIGVCPTENCLYGQYTMISRTVRSNNRLRFVLQGQTRLLSALPPAMSPATARGRAVLSPKPPLPRQQEPVNGEGQRPPLHKAPPVGASRSYRPDDLPTFGPTVLPRYPRAHIAMYRSKRADRPSCDPFALFPASSQDSQG